MNAPNSKLFSPIKVGNVQLKHRVVMAPLTRFRANDAHVHGDLAAEYYSQRASTPGTLIISEATFISQAASGYANTPGLWNEEQITGWKQVSSWKIQKSLRIATDGLVALTGHGRCSQEGVFHLCSVVGFGS